MWAVVFVGLWGHNGVEFFSSKKKANKFIKKEMKPNNYTYFLAKVDSYSNKEDILLITEE